MLEPLSNNFKGLEAVTLATLLKGDSHAGVSEPTVCRCSIKYVFLNNSQDTEENTSAGVSFENSCS